MMPLIRDVHRSAKTLLAHFHFICKGQKPFGFDWAGDISLRAIQRMANVSTEEAEFLDTITKLVKQKGKH